MPFQVALLDSEGFSFVTKEPFNYRSMFHVYKCTDTAIYVSENYEELFDFTKIHELSTEDGAKLMTPFYRTWYDCHPYRPDYFAPTPGNVLHIIKILLSWAEQFPEGKWRVTKIEESHIH